MPATKYPDHDLIKELTSLYLGKSTSVMTTSQITDLINHLREANRELNSVLEEVTTAYFEHLKSEDGERFASIETEIVRARGILEKNKYLYFIDISNTPLQN